MTIRVLFFASLREALGDSIEIELPSDATLSGLRAHLEHRLGDELATTLNAADVRVAVNQNLVHDESLELEDGDEVAFMPPITGG